MAFKARTVGIAGAHIIGHPLAITSVTTDRWGNSRVEAYLIAQSGGRPLPLRIDGPVNVTADLAQALEDARLPAMDLEQLALDLATGLLADHLADLEPRVLEAARHFGLARFEAEPLDNLAAQLSTRFVQVDFGEAFNAIREATADDDLRRLVARIQGLPVRR